MTEHLEAVASLARDFSSFLGAPELGYCAGLWHDLGKFHPEFQAYLLAEAVSRGPDHSTAGALHAAKYLDLLALAIAGHHSGIPAKTGLADRLRDRKQISRAKEALALARNQVPDLEPIGDLRGALPAFLEKGGVTALELFIRLLYSALVDADFLDTEAHFEPDHAELRGRTCDLGELWLRLERAQERLSGQQVDPVNMARHEIYQACLDAAALPPGFFSLTVPTGGGKTRSAMAFALRHALIHGLRRVVVAIPYTSIIEQTADVYRDIFGADNVLEHHSALTVSEEDADDTAAGLRARLAAENWEAPVVVTTTVQLFESLFGHTGSRCRKLHNLAASVIILDEVQTLPVELLPPIADGLQQLVDNYRTSIVLCTATQPALYEGPLPRGLKNIREIVPEPQRYFTALRRVAYEFPLREEPWTWERVAGVMRGEKQCLAVVNTRKDALRLVDAVQAEAGDTLHLSSLMCGAHRRAVLREIKDRLAVGEPCRVVSTQVVEAGVDLDFPVVLRAAGPLDRIIQAAGRCNREGRLPAGRAIVFQPRDGGLPGGIYRTATDNFLSMVRQEDTDLYDLGVIETYFRRLYQTVKLDPEQIQRSREHLDYPEVAAKFRLIKGDTVPAVVPYGEGPELLDRVRRAGALSRRVVRLLQPYLVSIDTRQKIQLEQEGLLREVVPGLWEWRGRYDSLRGLMIGVYDPADLVG